MFLQVTYLGYTAQSRAQAAATSWQGVAAVVEVIRFIFLWRRHMYSIHIILHIFYVPPTMQRTSYTGLLTGILHAIINISSIVCLVYAPLPVPRDDSAVVHALHRRLLPVIIFRLEKFWAIISSTAWQTMLQLWSPLGQKSLKLFLLL